MKKTVIITFSTIIVVCVVAIACFFGANYFSKQSVSTLITNGDIVTVNNNMDEIKNGVVAINDDKIVEVGGSELTEKYRSSNTIDAKGGIVMPGMVNTHQHLPMIAFRGLGEEGIKDRLQSYFFPLEGQKLSRDLIYKATIHGCMEMASGGVTTYADMYFHMDEMAKATKQVGLRGVLGEGVTKFKTVDAQEPYGGLNYAKDFLDDYKDDELITPALAPHATYSVEDEQLLKVKELADKNGCPIMYHVAEFDNEAKRMNLPEGKTVVEHLEEIGFLDENVVFAHAINLSDSDLDIMAKHNVKVAHNPRANAKDATGIAPVMQMLSKNITVGLGTDGPMSSNTVDLFGVMNYASCMQRIKYNDITAMPPDQVVYMATQGGANVLGMGDKIGSIEEGKLADIVILSDDDINMTPNYNPYATIVFAANSNNVSTVLVGGKTIVSNKKVQTYSYEQDSKDMKAIEEDVAQFGLELAQKAK